MPGTHSPWPNNRDTKERPFSDRFGHFGWLNSGSVSNHFPSQNEGLRIQNTHFLPPKAAGKFWGFKSLKWVISYVKSRFGTTKYPIFPAAGGGRKIWANLRLPGVPDLISRTEPSPGWGGLPQTLRTFAITAGFHKYFSPMGTGTVHVHDIVTNLSRVRPGWLHLGCKSERPNRASKVSKTCPISIKI